MSKTVTRSLAICIAAVVAITITGCDGDDLDSDTEARWAYLAFDRAVDRALELGFDGFNAASSANIPAQSANGDVAGTMTVSGQVDQGASDNKEMRLLLDLVDYADEAVDDPLQDDEQTIEITYNTGDGAPLALDLSLRNIPTGTFTGTLTGTAFLSGEIDADAQFMLSLSGGLQEGAGGIVQRAPNTLVITGTVRSSDGTYDVDVTR